MSKVSAFLNSLSKDKISYQNLRKLNSVAAIVLALQGLLILILCTSGKGVIPLNSNYSAKDTLSSDTAGQTVLLPASHHLFDVNIAYLVAAFLFMGAIVHFLVANNYRKKYEKGLKTGTNKARWVGYAFSASTMMVVVATLLGVHDAASLLMIFGLSALMCMAGLAMEVHTAEAKKPNWLDFKIGISAGLFAWVAIASYLKGAIFYGNSLPIYVYFVFGSMIALFAGFAVVEYLSYKRRGKFASYLFTERVFIALNFVAMTALAWQVFFGTLR